MLPNSFPNGDHCIHPTIISEVMALHPPPYLTFVFFCFYWHVVVFHGSFKVCFFYGPGNICFLICLLSIWILFFVKFVKTCWSLFNLIIYVFCIDFYDSSWIWMWVLDEYVCFKFYCIFFTLLMSFDEQKFNTVQIFTVFLLWWGPFVFCSWNCFLL